MTLRLLCAAEPADSHHARQIGLLERAGVEVHLLDHSVNFRRGGTPAKTHVAWPKNGRRTLSRVLGDAVAGALAEQLSNWQLRALWRRTGAQLCHVHWADERVLAAAKARLRPLVLTAYGSDLNSTRSPTYDPIQLEALKQGLDAVDLLIADSDDMIETAHRLAGREIPALLLPIGVDSDLFRPGYEAEAAAWRNELGIPTQATVVFSPRVMRPNYRHVELVPAFAHAVREEGLDGYFVFKAYASDPAYVRQVSSAAREAGLSDRVRIIDEVPYERLPVLYALADLAVTFATMDAFPVTFLEAGACELPMLANRLSAYQSNGMGEHLNFMSAEDPAAIGADISRIARSNEARARARTARRHITQCLDEKSFVRRLLGAYSGLLERAVQ